MELETMRPNPVFDENVYDDEIEVFEALAGDVVVKVWGGDWCKDCRSQLPDFGAALDAAGVENVEHYPVEKQDDGSKVGPQVEAYGIELIPTVVVERAPRSGADGAGSAEGTSADRSSGRRGGETASNGTAEPSRGPREDEERERGSSEARTSEQRTAAEGSREPGDPLADADSGEELARFVEEEDRPIAVYLAERLEQYAE